MLLELPTNKQLYVFVDGGDGLHDQMLAAKNIMMVVFTN